MVPWGRTCMMRTSLTWGDVVMAVDSQVSIWHWLRLLRTKRNMYAKYNQVVSNLPCHSCLSAFLADVDIRRECFILKSSLDQPKERFSHGWAMSKGYSQCSTLPTGIWNGRPVSITWSQAFAMTSARLMGADRKGWRHDTGRCTSGNGWHGWGDMWEWTDSGCWEQPRHTSSKVNLWEMSLYR